MVRQSTAPRARTDNDEIVIAVVHTPIRRHECRILTRYFCGRSSGMNQRIWDCVRCGGYMCRKRRGYSDIENPATRDGLKICPNEVMSVWCRSDTAGRTFRFVKVFEMAEANPMICPDCGVPMNHHADKIRKETHPDDVSAFDSGLGGVIEEFHTCPQCGKTQSRHATHSETS